MPLLHHRVEGEGQPLVILHGLLGSSDNWRAHMRELASYYQVVLVDLRNHGQSFHDSNMAYDAQADDLRQLLDHLQLPAVFLLGHSMGGKTAMQLALAAPDRVKKLVVGDIAPVTYSDRHSALFRALMGLPLNAIRTRADADRLLALQVEDRGVRAFVLKNLVRKDDAWRWACNLPVLFDCLDQIRGWPAHPAQYLGPTLFMAGAQSDYIRPSDQNAIAGHFPNARGVRIAGAGHWLHADQPERFLSHLRRFLEANP